MEPPPEEPAREATTKPYGLPATLLRRLVAHPHSACPELESYSDPPVLHAYPDCQVELFELFRR